MKSRKRFMESEDHRIRFVFTPRHRSWLTHVEIWFSILARRVRRRGSFTSVDDLRARVRDFIGYVNAVLAKPFRWADPRPGPGRKLKDEFGIDLVVFVGDRGMITQTRIGRFVEQSGVEWITALKSGSIRKSKTEGCLQLGLSDERNLFELQSRRWRYGLIRQSQHWSLPPGLPVPRQLRRTVERDRPLQLVPPSRPPRRAPRGVRVHGRERTA